MIIIYFTDCTELTLALTGTSYLQVQLQTYLK